MKQLKKINEAIGGHVWMIVLTMVLPQLLLVLFRLRDVQLIGSVLEQSRGLIYTHYVGLPLLLAGCSAGLAWWSWKGKKEVPRWGMLGFFLLQTGVLVAFFCSMERLLPATVDTWMLPAGRFMMLQLASFMPGLFYGLLCLANIRWFHHALANIGISTAMLVVPPAGLFVVGNFFPWHRLPDALMITVFVGCTLVAAFAFIQLLLGVSRRMGHGWLATAVFALVTPISGLLLNRAIPFPADLQHWGFYALAVANGGILMWGCAPRAAESRICAALTAVSYAFTCYFFFLFLPFLPFSLLAMIAAGTGFLILTPTVLFVLHTRRLIFQFQRLRSACSARILLCGMVVAFLVIPVGYVGRALMHRRLFNQLLDQVYTPDFSEPVALPSPRVAKYVLKRLKASKEGVYVPILSEVYNRIVFGGMVLPDRKVEQLETLLYGDDAGPEEWNREVAFYSLFTGESQRRSGRRMARVNRNVSLTDVSVSEERGEGWVEATVLLTMKSRAAGQAEFRTDLSLPDGVFVSGYALKIGDEMVPGRLSDRRAAMWVYHMIRDRARRDPGLLIYTGPNQLQLSVFPFAAQEERQCELKLLYPASLAARLEIGKRSVALPHDAAAVASGTTPEGRRWISLSAESAVGIKRQVTRVELTGSAQSAGFCPEWEVKRALLAYWASGEAQLDEVPWFVTTSEQPLLFFDRAAYWLPLLPDGGWSATQPGDLFVVPLQCGEQVRVIPSFVGGWAVFDEKGPLQIFSDETKAMELWTGEDTMAADSRYAQAVDLWQAWWQTQLMPELGQAQRRELLAQARALNVLIPSASFLAVENKAQAEALRRAEKKSLKNRSALAFDAFDEAKDSPEPQMLLLMLLVLPVVHGVMLKRRARSTSLQPGFWRLSGVVCRMMGGRMIGEGREGVEVAIAGLSVVDACFVKRSNVEDSDLIV